MRCCSLSSLTLPHPPPSTLCSRPSDMDSLKMQACVSGRPLNVYFCSLSPPQRLSVLWRQSRLYSYCPQREEGHPPTPPPPKNAALLVQGGKTVGPTLVVCCVCVTFLETDEKNRIFERCWLTIEHFSTFFYCIPPTGQTY